jgi:hypothetical protein
MPGARSTFARRFFTSAVENELLLRPIGRTVYLMPPYVLDEEEIAGPGRAHAQGVRIRDRGLTMDLIANVDATDALAEQSLIRRRRTADTPLRAAPGGRRPRHAGLLQQRLPGPGGAPARGRSAARRRGAVRRRQRRLAPDQSATAAPMRCWKSAWPPSRRRTWKRRARCTSAPATWPTWPC